MHRVKLAILISGNADTKSSTRLFSALASVLPVEISYIDLDISSSEIFDVLLFRAGENLEGSDIEKAVDVYSSINAPIKIDSKEGLLLCNNKIKQYKRAIEFNVPLPKTFFVTRAEELQEIDLSLPWVIKFPFGSGGRTVFKIETQEDANIVALDGLSKYSEIIIQEFIPLREVEDYRVYCIGSDCSLGIKKIAKAEEFRANLRQGGRKIAFSPPQELQEMAKKICEIFGMEIAAIDFIYYEGNYFFLEINDSFGFKEDNVVAEKILKYCINKFQL